MGLLEPGEDRWVMQGGANVGMIAYEGGWLMIDGGMDKDVGREMLKRVKELGLVPTALRVTHAHADLSETEWSAFQYCGAHYLVRQTGLHVYATRVEAAVMSGPILEPLYLFSGAQPPRKLQHKFLLAKPCLTDSILQGNEQTVDHIPAQVIPLPGHSTEQVGVAFGDTFFVGDAFLTPDILDKHRIPFYTDVEAGLLTLTTLKTRIAAFKHIVAGHGEMYTSVEGATQAID